MREKIIQKAKELKVSDIGFAPAEVYEDLKEILRKRGEVPFVREDFEMRTDPFRIMEDVQSIIVFLCSYHTGESGVLSEYAMGADYHEVLAERSRALCALLEENGYMGVAYADNGPLNDRYLAYRAGLGFFGKNGFLISPKWGTYTVIGYILTDCPIEPGHPMARACDGCGRCIRACPGRALGWDMEYNGEKCASYITQKKGELTAEETQIIRRSGFVWGCDICQRVCPHNLHAAQTDIPEFRENLIKEILIHGDMSNREFKTRYTGRAFSWRGKRVLERNIQILQEK